jgi:hypothetical protein
MQKDGPTLEHGKKDIDKTKLSVPPAAGKKPD